MGSPDGGSSLVQVAPMPRQRISAAGPGRFSARLRMRMPCKGAWGRVMASRLAEPGRGVLGYLPMLHAARLATLPPMPQSGIPHPGDTRMKFKRTLAALLALGAAAMAQAQGNWPTKPIPLVVPFAAGGPTDVVARTLGAAMTRSLGQTVVVENKLGAGGTVAAAYVAKAAP